MKRPTTVSFVVAMNKYFASFFPGKEDLVTEWALNSLAKDSGQWPGREEHFVEMADFYFKHWKEPRFQEAVKALGAEQGLEFYHKNLMTFTLDDLFDVNYKYGAEEEFAIDYSILPDPLPEGARLFYSGVGYQIVEVTLPQTACTLSSDTSWCTKRLKPSAHYIAEAPLYVIYENGERVAQLHIGPVTSQYDSGVQLRDTNNEGLVPDSGIREALIQSGLMDQILEVVMAANNKDQSQESRCVRWTGKEEHPYFRKKCLENPAWAYCYAAYALDGQRFPEGEELIADDPELALRYAITIIKGRWPMGEFSITSKENMTQHYARMLQMKDPEGFVAFMRKQEEDEQKERENEAPW
jgi:hypothetical protein